MSYFQITGGSPLRGAIPVHGAKNSVLPILAACLLARGEVTLRNCPELTDVSAALAILEHLGFSARREGDAVTVTPAAPAVSAVPEGLMRSMRSSIIFLGPLLARTGEAHLSMPGGCEIGARPIDLHLGAIRALGASITEDERGLHCKAGPGGLRGGDIHLSLASVGATENAMLCACGAAGTTTITNAAREPEIVALADFLNLLGGKVTGAGGGVVTVEGGRPLGGGVYTIMGDRIVAATLLACGACAGGDISITGVDWRQVSTVAAVLSEAGCRVTSGAGTIRLRRDPGVPLRGVSTVRTAPYPGFPTDAQAPVMAALCASRGATVFVENLFESRYRHVPELSRMGADIDVEGRVAVVRGVPRLHAAQLEARDLRGGGALAAAALGSEGVSTLFGLRHIDRGYQRLEGMLSALGGKVLRVEDQSERTTTEEYTPWQTDGGGTIDEGPGAR